MDYDALIQFIQGHFTDGLVVVVGSGLSMAEGLPGMSDIAASLCSQAGELSDGDFELWQKIKRSIENNEGLEAALLKDASSETLREWIVKCTCDLLLPKEQEVISAVLAGEKTLRMTTFLNKILRPPTGLPILTPNYDRLIEVACELAGFHVDTLAVGHYAGAFDHQQSCMASCKGITRRGKTSVLNHFPRAVVLKPHGSFDWYQTSSGPRRCSYDLPRARLVITPGVNKYKEGYAAPFDTHRDRANDYVKQSAHLLIVGYGFNDDHLQIHLLNQIHSGTPTLILTQIANQKTVDLVNESPNCVCVSKHPTEAGVSVCTSTGSFEKAGSDLWDLGVLTKELLP